MSEIYVRGIRPTRDTTAKILLFLANAKRLKTSKFLGNGSKGVSSLLSILMKEIVGGGMSHPSHQQ